MQAVCIFHIRVQGQLEEHNFNALSPYQITQVCEGQDSTRLAIHADQSGLIGLLRHLHQQGYLLLSIDRQEI